jgi:WXXGXW repeat (2 copies)
MKNKFFKILSFAIILTASAVALDARPRFSIGIGIGGPAYFGYGYGGGYYGRGHYGAGYVFAPPPAPLPRAYYAAPYPGYSWIDGYWYPSGARYAWRPGYWERPPFRGAHWYAPRYNRGRYYRGYWGRR